MEPLLTLAAVTAAILGWAAVTGRRLSEWWLTALRGGLAAMFLLTGGAHFVGLRDELIGMVPPPLPRPDLLVTATGVLELAGAIGLLLRRVARAAAVGLGALLIGMYPANLYAAMDGRPLAWSDQLIPRTVIQVVFLAAVLAVVWGTRRFRARRWNRTEGSATRS